MAKVSTTLQNIEYIKEQEQKRELTKQEEQEEKRKYNNFVNETIHEEINYQFINSKDIEETYKNIILKNDLLNKIIKEIDKEAQTHYKIIEEWKTENKNTWKEKTKKMYLWDDLINYEEIEQKFYKKLDIIYKQEIKKQNIKNNILLEKVKNEMIHAFNLYGYSATMQTYYKIESMETISKHYSKNGQEYLYIKNNYYKILDNLSTQYKKIDKIQSPKETYKKNIVERNKGKIILSGAIIGFFKGLKNASK